MIIVQGSGSSTKWLQNHEMPTNSLIHDFHLSKFIWSKELFSPLKTCSVVTSVGTDVGSNQ